MELTLPSGQCVVDEVLGWILGLMGVVVEVKVEQSGTDLL